MFSKIPKAEAKKIDQNNAAPGNAVHNNKGHKENVLRKNVAPKATKGVSSRYGHQVELKEQNQHLINANEELQKNLSTAQQSVAELQQQVAELKNENAEIQKSLRDCHVLLVTAKIDPVLGEVIGDAAKEKEDQRKEVMRISTELLKELKAFGSATSQQRNQLQEIQATMVDLSEAREQMKEERETFSQQAAELEIALTEAEALLL